jgi:photosynthetic reaction center cytochrome c subunit
MTIKTKRLYVVFASLGACFAFNVIAARAQSNAPSEAAATPRLAEEQFKNIQAFKGLPADQVIPAMQFISASLGVECEYCHVHGAFEKDDKKPKQTARKMIQMMFAVNKANFDGKREVTCYSCHRGAADPVGTPLITAEEAYREETKKHGDPQAALPNPNQLLDKYIATVGGAAALQKVTSRIQKGVVTAFGEQHPIEIYSKAPDKRISFTHIAGGESVTAFDGHAGWLAVPKRPVHMMSAGENSAARMDADLYFPVHVQALYQNFTAEPGEKIDGHETSLVVARSEGQPPLKLYLDSQSGTLIRIVRYADSPLGLNPTQVDYADYRDVDGVKIPFRWTVARPGNRFTIQIEQVQQNVPVDDAKFAMPAAPPDQKAPGH